MMSALEGEGGHVKAETVEEVARILYYKSVPNADKGEGGQNSKNVVVIISGSSLIDFVCLHMPAFRAKILFLQNFTFGIC